MKFKGQISTGTSFVGFSGEADTAQQVVASIKHRYPDAELVSAQGGPLNGDISDALKSIFHDYDEGVFS